MPSLSAMCRNALERALIEYGENAKYVIYPFGEGGKILKGILNYEFGIQEFAIVDNFLADISTKINKISFLKDHQDAMVLVSIHRADKFDMIRKQLYENIQPDRCLYIYEDIHGDDAKAINDKMKAPELWDLILKKYYLATSREDNIYVIGDSHVSFFAGCYLEHYVYKAEIGLCRPRINPFRIFHIGPALAYNLNKYGTTTKAREKIEYILGSNIIPIGGKILCVFGEIDIRVHVWKQARKKNIDFHKVVSSIVDEYVTFIGELTKNYRVYVWCPVASQGDDCEIDDIFPRVGTQIERNKATEYFIDELKRRCSVYRDVVCLSIFSYLVDKEYKTKTQLYRDAVHLAQHAWSIADCELKKHGIYYRKI